MNLRDYQKGVLRTSAVQHDKAEMAKMAVVGAVDELGEVVGPLKKFLWHGHELPSREKMIREMGDVMYYIALLAESLELDMQEIIDTNHEKLKKRYPDGFSSQKSINRAAGDD